MTVQIYGLFDPFTGALRYIGQTALALPDRLVNHLYEYACYKWEWILSLKQRGAQPQITLLETLDDRDDKLEAEAEWIEWAIGHGHPILNLEARPVEEDTRHPRRRIYVSLPQVEYRRFSLASSRKRARKPAAMRKMLALYASEHLDQVCSAYQNEDAGQMWAAASGLCRWLEEWDESIWQEQVNEARIRRLLRR